MYAKEVAVVIGFLAILFSLFFLVSLLLRKEIIFVCFF